MSEEFFLPLVRQQANLLSIEAAQSVAKAVRTAVAADLDEAQLKRLGQLLPDFHDYAQPHRFYHRLDKKPRAFRLSELTTRIQMLTHATSHEEAEQYLSGYFAASQILAGEANSRRLANILPPELYNFIRQN